MQPQSSIYVEIEKNKQTKKKEENNAKFIQLGIYRNIFKIDFATYILI